MKTFNLPLFFLKAGGLNGARKIALGMFAALLFLPMSAFAQVGGVFDGVGAKAFKLLCEFINSPVLAFGVAIVAGGLLWGFGSGDENGLATKFVKFLLMAVLIFALIPILDMIGFSVVKC